MPRSSARRARARARVFWLVVGLAFLGLAAAFNPRMSDFESWMREGARSRAARQVGSGLLSDLSGGATGVFVRSMYRRQNYLVCSRFYHRGTGQAYLGFLRSIYVRVR